MIARHVFEEHIGEARVRLEAPSLAELFRQAALALAELMGAGAAGAAAPVRGAFERVELRATDRDALLVDWLNELVYRAERARKVFGEIAIERIDDGQLVATIRGYDAPDARSLVKAATFHGLEIVETPDGWRATVVLDI